MATYISYTPRTSIEKAMFNFDVSGRQNYKYSGTINISVSDGFSNYDYRLGLVNSTDYTMNPYSNEINWSPIVKSNIQDAFTLFTKFANISFSELVDYDTSGFGAYSIASPADVGIYSDINISFMNANESNFLGVSGGSSDSDLGYTGARGDILINYTGSAFYNDGVNFSEISKSRQVLIHEISHSLGLSHPFYGSAITADFANLTSVGFHSLGFSVNSGTDLNKEYFTIMSYDDQSDITYINAYTPMILDVIALQGAYGIGSGTTGSTDDVITAGTIGYRTYFDTGGIDTIDLVQYTQGSYVNLGASINGAQYSVGLITNIQDANNLFNGIDPESLRWLYGDYENVNGSLSSDLIIGNSLANIIYGLDGNDTLYGGADNDTLDGGTGTDFLYGGSGNDTYFLYQTYAGNDLIDEDLATSSADTIYWVNASNPQYITTSERVGNDLKIYTYYERALFSTTTVVNQYAGSAIEFAIINNVTYRSHLATTTNLIGTSGNDLISGSSLDNEMNGGDGTDSLDGGGGNDTLRGGNGNDVFVGGTGNDLLFGDAGDDAFIYTSGSDTFDGGTGNDAIVFGFNRSLIQQVTGNSDSYRINIDGAQLSVTSVEFLQFIDGSYTAAQFLFWATPTPTFAATYSSPVSSIQSIGLSPDGQFLLIKMGGAVQSVATGSTMSFNGQAISTSDLTSSIAPIPVFKSTGGVGGFTLPELFTGAPELNLKYQLIETADNAVVIGSSDNDFIKVASANSVGKAVSGGGGDDVIDGGVGSTFISGGGALGNTDSSTYFLDGRAPGTSWSTITDFKLDVDKATIWGFVKGVSSVDTSFMNFNQEGATGYQGLTLHFKNLLPSGQTQGSNANLNSITFSGKTLADFGASSLAELNTQINNQTNPNFLVGATQDNLGTHGYLFIN
jgi:Ca2+-binding RTX toxin-like protein